MRRPIAILALILAACYGVAQDNPAPESPFPGVTLARVPEILHAHLPELGERGLIVEEIVKDSSAALAGFRKHDVLLSVAGKTVAADGAWLSALQAAAKKVDITLIRAGKQQTLTIAWPFPGADNVPRGYLKPNGPPAVRFDAQPKLQKGQFNVTIEFYGDSSKLTRLTCDGSVGDIQRQVEALSSQNRLPDRIRDLVDVAIDRLRTLNTNDPKNP
jgi:hypothetical protein